MIYKSLLVGHTNLGREVLILRDQFVVRDKAGSLNDKGSHVVSFDAAVQLLTAPWARWQPGVDERLDRAVRARLAAREMTVLDSGRNWPTSTDLLAEQAS